MDLRSKNWSLSITHFGLTTSKLKFRQQTQSKELFKQHRCEFDYDKHGYIGTSIGWMGGLPTKTVEINY